MNQKHPTSEELVEYLHRELPESQDATVYAHLAECAQCAQAHEAEASLTDLLRAHARSQERELPHHVLAAIRKAVQRPAPVPVWERLRSALRPVVALPAAAAIAAALYLGISGWHAASATSIKAADYVTNHAALTAGSPFSEDPPVPAVLASETDAR